MKALACPAASHRVALDDKKRSSIVSHGCTRRCCRARGETGYYPTVCHNNDVRVVSSSVDERVSTDVSGNYLLTALWSIGNGHKLGMAMGFEFENEVWTHLAGYAADGSAPYASAMQWMVVACRSFVAPRLLSASRFVAVHSWDAYITLTFSALVIAAFLYCK